MFNKASAPGSKRQYRLFSVVQHVGQLATRGHYVCWTLDSSDRWVKFDDTRWQNSEWEDIAVGAQAYLLVYELIQ